MATIVEATVQQSTGEIRRWEADFTADLPTGGTITAGTATHIPPSGSAATPTITFDSTSVTAVIGPLAVTGVHYLDIQATFSDGEKSEIRTAFSVNYPATGAREGMLALIRKLRGMTNAGANDYSVAGEPYWSDAQLQEILDANKTEVFQEQLVGVAEYTGGVPYTKRFFSQSSNFESGTAVFKIEDGSGNLISTSDYTADYINGEFTFANDTGGTVYYLTGKYFDLDAAAADVWDNKAAHFAEAYDFATDGHSMKRSQLSDHCIRMARRYRDMSKSANRQVDLTRGDANVWTY